MNIPRDVSFIIEKLNSFGYSAYAVGGCIRDAFLGKSPNDWDITTSALPHDIKNVFNGFTTCDTGIKYGTVTLILSGNPYEITTYRTEKDYKDFRHPSEITFSDDICEDLSRRDFTMNAIAYNHLHGFKDPFGGIGDIKNKLIRCVGDPMLRFNEDPLRILRGIRFAIQTEFTVDCQTADAIKNLASLLSHISAERIKAEFDKIFLLNNKTQAVFTEFKSVILKILPDLINSDFDEICSHIDFAENDLAVKWALFFQNLSTEKAQSAMKQLRFSNKLYFDVTSILKASSDVISVTQMRRLLSLYGADVLRRIILFQHAKKQITDTDSLFLEIEKIITSGQCYSLKTLAVNGSDICHIFSGSMISTVLKRLLDMVINDELENDKTVLMNYIKKNFIQD